MSGDKLKTSDILSLHSDTCVRVCLSFQVFDAFGSSSRMFNRVLDMTPGDDVKISVYSDLLK